jgi:hypothetical protein
MGVWIRGWIYWHTCTHHLELRVIAALSLISTFYKSLARAKCLPSLLCLQQPFPSNGFQLSKFFSFPRSRPYSPANIPQLNSLSRPGVLRYIASGRTQHKALPPTISPIVVMGGCLAIARISLTCLPAATKQRMFLLAIVAKQRYYMLQYILL